MPVKYPPIPEPSTNTEQLRRADQAIKETLEIMTGQRGSKFDSMVTWNDLVDLGLILPSQVPR